jgi:hypothetical protein
MIVVPYEQKEKRKIGRKRMKKTEKVQEGKKYYPNIIYSFS